MFEDHHNVFHVEPFVSTCGIAAAATVTSRVPLKSTRCRKAEDVDSSPEC